MSRPRYQDQRSSFSSIGWPRKDKEHILTNRLFGVEFDVCGSNVRPIKVNKNLLTLKICDFDHDCVIEIFGWRLYMFFVWVKIVLKIWLHLISAVTIWSPNRAEKWRHCLHVVIIDRTKSTSTWRSTIFRKMSNFFMTIFNLKYDW